MTTPEDTNDVDFELEDEAQLDDLGKAQAKIRKVKDELEKVKAEKQEYLDGWQRCKADMVNAKQEYMRQAQRTGSRALETLIEDIIPVLDSFDMAAGSPAWENVEAQWRSGVEGIRNQLSEVLARHGIERFGKIGETVNHTLHEVVQESDDLPGDSGTIVKVLRFGYRNAERTVRPAQVIVKT